MASFGLAVSRCFQIVGFSAGSSPDALARLICDDLTKKYKQPFIVENRLGAGGLIALKQMIQTADDHQLVVSTNGPLTTSPLLYKSFAINAEKDYQVVGLLASSPLVFVVANNSPYKNMREFAAALEKRGLDMTDGSVGLGRGSHLASELMLARLNVQATHVWRAVGGTPEALTNRVQSDI